MPKVHFQCSDGLLCPTVGKVHPGNVDEAASIFAGSRSDTFGTLEGSKSFKIPKLQMKANAKLVPRQYVVTSNCDGSPKVGFCSDWIVAVQVCLP